MAWLADRSTLPPIHYLISSPSGGRCTNNLTPWCSWCFIRLVYDPSYCLTRCTDSDKTRRLLCYEAWLRGSDCATVLRSAQVESDAVRNLAVENQRGRDRSGSSGNPSGPDDKGRWDAIPTYTALLWYKMISDKSSSFSTTRLICCFWYNLL